MSFKIDYLKWDSDFLNLNVGKIYLSSHQLDQIQSLNEIALEYNYHLLYVFTDESNLIKITENNNGNISLVDRKIVYYLNLHSRVEFLDPRIMKLNKEGDLIQQKNDLYKLAYLSAEYSRFKLDEKLPDITFRRLYSEWVNKSVEGTMADEIFINTEENEILGFITLKICAQENRADIGLLAVAPEQRGKKIGMALIEKCISSCIEKGINQLNVPTQLDNIPACNLYNKIGFKKESITNIYHLWI